VAVPGSTLTAPTANRLLDSNGAPTARSPKPSLLKSPAAKASPNESPSSEALPTPGVSWVNNWLPVPVSPAAPPYSTLTAPTPNRLLDSPGAPTARSAKPSLLKSPAAKTSPKKSPSSAVLPTPGLSWVNNWLPDPVSPAAPP
jgi:hypothetical protein